MANVRAAVGDGTVTLMYELAAEADHVVITRSAADASPQIVYDGKAASFTDRALTNGVEYRYVLQSVDVAGTTSAGVAISVTPRRNYLLAPRDGALLRKPPKLVWAKNRDASYYNIQLYRGEVKVLTAWPVKPTLRLKRSWTFSGTKQRLSPGTYHWYVWPGFGPRSSIDYGEMLGSRTFEIVR